MGWLAEWKKRRRQAETVERQQEVDRCLFRLACEALAEGHRFSVSEELCGSPQKVQTLVVRLTQKLGRNIRANSAYGVVFVYDEDEPGLGVTMVGVKR